MKIKDWQSLNTHSNKDVKEDEGYREKVYP